MKRLWVFLLCSFAGGAASAEEDLLPPDAVGPALEAMGIRVEDLGYRPKAHWARYPHPRTVPYVLPFFEDLLAHPLDTYEFTRTLGNVVEDGLRPELLAKPSEDKKSKELLFKLGVLLATDRRIGGFRAYSANLDPRPAAEAPLLHALELLLARSGRPLERPRAFGAAYSKDEPDPRVALAAKIDAVPAALRRPLAALVNNLVEARRWIDLGLRRVPEALQRKVYAALPKLLEDTPDGTRYYPSIDDTARLLDEHSLWYGCLKTLQAVQDARREIGGLDGTGWPGFRFRLETPWGSVLFDHGAEAIDERESFVLVAFGDVPSVRGAVGATAAGRPLSVALLLGEVATAGQPKERARLAAGILGCGVVYSAGVRTTAWTSGQWGLGAGLFGLGALIDEGGDDQYALDSVGMGAGLFGAGLLLDAAGKDEYRLAEGDGQGFGGPGGIGVLADRSGDDFYYVEPDAKKAGRADYHSKDKIAASNAQGAGFGRRGDGSDGHVWAGGLGALLDVEGNDRYVAGNFSQGIGYWYGTGLLWDGGGDDRFESVYFTQGSGAHFAVGALIDEGGNDVHILGENAGAAYGFGWDVVNAFLIDRGHGNDRYEARTISIGVAEVRSNAFFFDEGGDDTYVLDRKRLGFGDVDRRPDYDKVGRTSTYASHLGQTALFLDLGGTDRYLRRTPDGKLEPDAEAADGRSWHLRVRDRSRRTGFNVSLGRDQKSGRLAFLDAWPPAPSLR